MNRLLLFLLVSALASALPSPTDRFHNETHDSDEDKEQVTLREVPVKDTNNDSAKVGDHSDEDEAEENKDDESSESDTKNKKDDKMGTPAPFVNHKSFACPKAKADLVTGTSSDTLSPEDIDIIAAMGDGLSTGLGLWSPPLEFRGAVFSIGGDASIDGLVTIPNILREFNANVSGASHGMGTRDQLPEYQLNVATTGAETSDLLNQAKELLRRLNLRKVDLNKHWVLISITIGSDEICATCAKPNADIIDESIDYLRRNVPKALVVMIGPLNFWSRNVKTAEFLRNQCPCFQQKSEDELNEIYAAWRIGLLNIERKFNDEKKFGVVTAPFISLSHISLAAVDDLFLPSSIYFNRQGHNYAAKWLWKRLMTGYSTEILSSPIQDELVCPSMGCPYFRTVVNTVNCTTWKYSDWTTSTPADVTISSKSAHKHKHEAKKKKSMTLYLVALTVVSTAFCVVLCVGTIFYNLSKRQVKGRFEMVPEAEM